MDRSRCYPMNSMGWWRRVSGRESQYIYVPVHFTVAMTARVSYCMLGPGHEEDLKA